MKGAHYWGKTSRSVWSDGIIMGLVYTRIVTGNGKGRRLDAEEAPARQNLQDPVRA